MGPQSEGWLSAFLDAIPNAATSPLALIAYLATLAAWIAISWRVRRLSVLLRKIESFPEGDRIKAIEIEMGHVKVSGGLTAEQFLRLRQKTFIFYGYLATCAMIVLLVGLIGYNVYEKKARADELTDAILGSPSAEYMSAVNVLANGAANIRRLKEQLPRQPTQPELADEVNEMVLRGIRDARTIARMLGEKYGGGLIQRANETLKRAARMVDAAYRELATCNREQQCGRGKNFEGMCKAANGIKNSIEEANLAARSIPGAMINQAGSSPNFGNGTMDLYFELIDAPNILYLNDRICGMGSSR